MSDPNRVGGTRGPGGRTLTDIFDRLGQLVSGIAALPQLATDVAAIRTAVERMSNGSTGNLELILARLSYLTGTSAPSATQFGAGLPSYLSRVFGNFQTYSPTGNNNVYATLTETLNVSILLNRILTERNYPSSSVNILNLILERLEAGAGGGPGLDYSTQLATIIAELQGSRADTRSIWGENLPFGWIGLSFWLERWIAAADPALPTPAFNAVVNLDRIANALASGAGDTAFSRLGSIRDNSLAILQAIGSLPSTPAGETLKTLLADLVACCEGNGGTNPPTDPPPPPAQCTGQQAYLVSGWYSRGQFSYQGQEVYVFHPLFTTLPTGFAYRNLLGEPWLAMTPFTNGTVCFSWDYPDGSIVSNQELITAYEFSWTQKPAYETFYASLPAFSRTNTRSFVVDNSAADAYEIWDWVVFTTAANLPPNRLALYASLDVGSGAS